MNSYLKIKTINYYYFLKDFIYLRERTHEREREGKSMNWGEGQREKHTPYGGAGSPMQGSIPGPWDHVLSRRQTLNRLSHPGAQPLIIIPFVHLAANELSILDITINYRKRSQIFVSLPYETVFRTCHLNLCPVSPF